MMTSASKSLGCPENGGQDDVGWPHSPPATEKRLDASTDGRKGWHSALDACEGRAGQTLTNLRQIAAILFQAWLDDGRIPRASRDAPGRIYAGRNYGEEEPGDRRQLRSDLDAEL